MKRIRVRPYIEGDLPLVGCKERIPGQEMELIRGYAYTGIAEDEHYVFCGGLTLYWPGHGEAWVYLCPDVQNYIGAFRAVRDLLWKLIKEHSLYRVSAHSVAGREADQRFLRHLGFVLEGFSPMWGPDREDYLHWGLPKAIIDMRVA